MPIWENGAPNSNNLSGDEIEDFDRNGVRIIRNITEAELFVYMPDEPNIQKAAVIICPGGGCGGSY